MIGPSPEPSTLRHACGVFCPPQRFLLHLLLTATLLLPALASAPPPAEAEERSSTGARLDTDGWSLEPIRIHGLETPGLRHVEARGLFRLPPRLVYRIIRGEIRIGAWPGESESVLEVVEADTMIQRYRVSVPILADRRYRLRFVHDVPGMHILFEKVPGYGNVNAIRGSWRIRARSDSPAQVDYELDLDPGMRLIPRFIVDWATRRALPSVFAYVHDTGVRVLRGEPCAPPDTPVGIGGVPGAGRVSQQ